MKHLIKLFFILCIVNVFTQSAFADTIPMQFNFVNNMPRTGNADINMTFNYSGPIVERNGGTASTTFNANKNQLISIGFDFPFMATNCMTPDGNYTLTLNPSIYTGDVITITYVALQPTNDFPELICTCSGSACDQSVAKKK